MIDELIFAYNSGFYKGFAWGALVTLIVGFLIIILFSYAGKKKK